MYKNQLQEFAQRSCINLPSYFCIREGPDHAPRFKARVNFNGEIYESPSFCSTLRQAEHSAAELALKTLSQRGPSRVLATRVLDETGVYKNLLQETAHRAGMKLPAYTTVRTGPGYAPVFTCTVELAGMSFSGEQARTKKQAQKSAAMVAWFALKQLSKECSSSQQSSSDLGIKEEQEQVIVARYLSRIKLPEDSRKPLVQREDRRRTRKESSPIFPYRIMPHHQNYASSSYPYKTYPIPSASPTPSSGLFPFIQSIFRPEMSTVFVTRDDHQELLPLAPRTPSPFFYLSENFLPVSHVRVEEIEENNNQKWLNKGINISSVHSSHHPRQQQHQMQQEETAITEKKKTSQSQTAIAGGSITEATESRSAAAAASLRPNLNVCSTGKQLRQQRMSCASSHQMAPAVQIRSVMPVCSSPPVIRISSSIQTLEGKRKSEEQSREEDISCMSSEFCRLKL